MDRGASPWFSYLPQAILNRAYKNRAYKASNGELAWARPDAVAVVKTLQSRGFAIHGVGIWLPTHPGPTIPTPFVYDWSAAAYAIRALEFIETFKWGPTDRSHGGMAPWFNILADRDDDAA